MSPEFDPVNGFERSVIECLSGLGCNEALGIDTGTCQGFQQLLPRCLTTLVGQLEGPPMDPQRVARAYILKHTHLQPGGRRVVQP
jgi:hypothetical protein